MLKKSIVILFLLCLPFQLSFSESQQDKRRHGIKAAILVNIARYTQWSDADRQTASKQILLCFIKDNPLNLSAKTITHRKFGNKTLEHRVIDDFNSSDNCHILFLSYQQTTRLNVKLNNPDVLTILDDTGKVNNVDYRKNFIITLVRKGNKIGLEINADALAKSSIKLSSELLKLSNIR